MNIWLSLEDPVNGKNFHTHLTKESIKKELIEMVIDICSKNCET